MEVKRTAMGDTKLKFRIGTPRYNFEKLVQCLREEFDCICEENDRLNQTLREWNKDKELQELYELAEWYRSHSLQTLSDDELCAIKEFRDRHYNSCGNGSTYQYELTGTGIGTAIKIRCPKCGEEIDVTDYASW